MNQRSKTKTRSPRLPAKLVVEPRRSGQTEKMGTWLRALAFRGGGIPEQTLWYYKNDGSCVCWSSENGEVTTVKQPREK